MVREGDFVGSVRFLPSKRTDPPGDDWLKSTGERRKGDAVDDVSGGTLRDS